MKPLARPNRCPSRRQSPATDRPALTLLEVVFATMIVAVMTVVALEALGAATRSGMSTGNRAIALGLADDLMAEILSTPYSGLNAYHNSSEQLTGHLAGWSRGATVQRVVPTNLTQATPGGIDQGAARIRVYVEFEGWTFAEQFGIRTDNQ